MVKMIKGSRLAFKVVTVFGGATLAICAQPADAADLAVLSNGFSIRHERHQTMGTTTRLFFSADDSNFTDLPTADIASYEKDLTSPPALGGDAGAALLATGNAPARVARSGPAMPLNQLVDAASATYHLDPDLVNSVIHAESGFNPRAISPKGARGLMQLMPQTASQLGVNDALDPQDNVDGGSRYLRELLERYNFDVVKALAAYNAGPQRVEQYHGVPPFRETRAYVARIVHEYNGKKIAQEKAAKQKLAAEKAAAKTRRSSPATAKSSTVLAAKLPASAGRNSPSSR